MHINIFCKFSFFILIFCLSLHISLADVHPVNYKAIWAAEVPSGYDTANKIAREYGLHFKGHVASNMKDKYLFKYEAESDDEEVLMMATEILELDNRITWLAVQETLNRERKSVLPSSVWAEDEDYWSNRNDRKKRHHTDVNCVCKNISGNEDETFGEHVYEVVNRQSNASLAHLFNDPKWPCQWELYNCGQTAGPHRVDLNVVPCWENGFTGKGVVVSIVDDGLDYVNKDLKHAYNANVSADLNDDKDEDGPLPNVKVKENDHGTKCGGEVAMEANNGYCGVGVAYDATLGGIRFLDGMVTDTSEAAALVFNANLIDIYSCSWGPQDSGKTWEGPGRLASAALEVGANKGRKGRGSIYVWAAGNGGAINDNCGADGYTCSIYTIGIASVSDEGLSTFYTESCSCIMAVTLNGGPHYMPKKFTTYKPRHYLVTTDPYDGCVNTFSGTSSAAPLASGVLALVLQARPELTWRDAQHLIVETSKIPNPNDNGWQINGAGYHVHHKYGFGLMDAAKLVMAAQAWTNVDSQLKCEVEFPDPERQIGPGEETIYLGHTNVCKGSKSEINKLEHVQVIMTFRAGCRGNVKITLTSPCGTVSKLIEPRPEDDSNQAVVDWPFMTVHNWGEDPRGTWTLAVEDVFGSVPACDDNMHDDAWDGIYVKNIHIVFWGTRSRYQSKVQGCAGKHEAIEQVMKEGTELHQDKLTDDPNKPIDLEKHINEKIIKADFIVEQKDAVGAEDFKKAEEKVADAISVEEDGKDGPKKSPPKSANELKELLEKFLRDGEEIEGESSRSKVPLTRTARSFFTPDHRHD